MKKRVHLSLKGTSPPSGDTEHDRTGHFKEGARHPE